jgi:hypothetical protein
VVLNPNLLSYIGIIFSIAFVIATIWKSIVDNRSRGFRKITRLGWICICFAILSGIASTLNIKANSDEQLIDKKRADSAIIAERRHSDSVRIADKTEFKNDVNQALKEHNLSYSEVTHTIMIKNPSKTVDPVMDIIDENTKLVGRFPDSIFINVEYKCINKGIAFNIDPKLWVNYYDDKKMISETEYTSAINTSLKSYDNKGMYDQFKIIMPQLGFKYDHALLYLKIDYTNAETKGYSQPPLRRVYSLNMDLLIKSINGLKLSLTIDPGEYLKERKVWMDSQIW